MIQARRNKDKKEKEGGYFPENLSYGDYIRVYTSIPRNSPIYIREGRVIKPESYRKIKDKGITKALRLEVLKTGTFKRENVFIRSASLCLEKISPYTKTFSYSNIVLIERLEQEKT